MGSGLRRIGNWFADRLGLQRAWQVLMKHPVPRETTNRRAGWLYVFGFVTLGVFLFQIVTGVALVTRYIPSTGSAYESIRLLTEEESFGRLIRGMHYWGASAMVLFVLIHMARVVLTGSYKFPREMNWLTGVALLVLVLAMAFTGQLLRWNQDGLWGVVVASQYAGRVPLIGDGLQRFILAGDAVGGATLSRFFALHAVLLPLLILGLVGVHLYLVLHHGISEGPRAGERVDPKTYRERYRELLDRDGAPYWPDAAWQEIAVTTVVIAGVILLALTIGPRALGEPPDPASIPSHPRPDWFLMWYYALLAVKPRGLEDFTMVYLPLLVLAGLILLPILFSRGERAPSRRPWAIGGVTAVVVVGLTLTIIGYRARWVPDFDTVPLTERELGEVDEEVLDGARIFHAKGCQYCHEVAGRGGEWGPELTGVLSRMSPSTFTDRVVNGIGAMPAYRGNITRAEMEGILTFLGETREHEP